MNLPDYNEDPSTSPFTHNRELIPDLGGEQAHPLPSAIVQDHLSQYTSLRSQPNQIIDQIVERVLSPSLVSDDGADSNDSDGIEEEVSPALSRAVFSRSLGSLSIVRGWAERVYYLWVPFGFNGLELRDNITMMLIHPTHLNQTPRDMRACGIDGPDVDSIAKGLLAVLLSSFDGTNPLLPRGVRLSNGFQIRNLINNQRNWHA